MIRTLKRERLLRFRTLPSRLTVTERMRVLLATRVWTRKMNEDLTQLRGAPARATATLTRGELPAVWNVRSAPKAVPSRLVAPIR